MADDAVSLYARGMTSGKTALFSALLRQWRRRQGWSQLDLALTAGVSSRHVSFLESGRSQPSRDMAIRLGRTLNLSLRQQNDLLRGAGFESVFEETAPIEDLPGIIEQALSQLFRQHEPFPVIAVNRSYDVLRLNQGAQRLVAALPTGRSPSQPPNFLRLLLDPQMARSVIIDWEPTALALLSRVQRDLLQSDNPQLSALLAELLDQPGVPKDFRQPQLLTPSGPVFQVRLRIGRTELGFLSMLTRFTAPQDVALEELQIESFFPLDEVTREACERSAQRGTWAEL
jgi:transcriptional regulator with XRE-family HTH domain